MANIPPDSWNWGECWWFKYEDIHLVPLVLFIIMYDNIPPAHVCVFEKRCEPG